MRLKISLFLILAAALAFAAGLVSFIYLGEVDKELRSTRAALDAFGEIETVTVLQRDVKAGEVLVAEDFAEQKLPRRYLPATALKTAPQPAEGEAMVALQDLGASELLFRDGLGFRAAAETPAAPLRLVDGKAAGRFAIQNFAELDEALAPGGHVDLFLFDRSAAKPQVRLVGSGFEILQLPRSATSATPLPVIAHSASLLLGAPPEDLARALLAAQSGELHAALSSGPRTVEAGQVIVAAEELVRLPIAVRAGAGAAIGGVVPAGSRQPVAILREDAASLPATELFSGGGCSTTVVRASQRQKIDVPC